MGVGFDMASWSEGEKVREKGQDRNIDSGELQVSPTELSHKQFKVFLLWHKSGPHSPPT